MLSRTNRPSLAGGQNRYDIRRPALAGGLYSDVLSTWITRARRKARFTGFSSGFDRGFR